MYNMDLFCFKYKLIINDLQKLFIHLNLVHSLRSNDVYKCCIFNCTQNLIFLVTKTLMHAKN